MNSSLARHYGLAVAIGLLATSLAGCVRIQSSSESEPSSSSSAKNIVRSAAPIEGTVTERRKNPEGVASGTGIVPKKTSEDSVRKNFKRDESHAPEKKRSRE